MKVVGLVTEYNPFHKGHLYHIEASKKATGADYCIAVMSGNFVQRGDPAILSKWIRAKSALLSGVDLVIELPVHYATSSAEFFSTAAIALLQNTGIVDSICFGSELGNLEVLDQIATVLSNESIEFKKHLSEFLNSGLSFPSARSKALTLCLPHLDKTIIGSPNNILGIEYLKALKKLNSPIKPYTIARIGAGYHDENTSHPIASATAIRKHLKQDCSCLKDVMGMLPTASYELLHEAIEQHAAPIFNEDLFPLLKYKLLTTTRVDLSKILDVTEGLENRMLQHIGNAASIEDFILALMTKRYTRTKINRALLHILLGIDKRSFEVFNRQGYAQYIKVLGFRKEAQPLMKLIKDHTNLPIIANVKDKLNTLTSIQSKMLLDEIRATDIYNTLVLSKYGTVLKNDYTHPMIIL